MVLETKIFFHHKSMADNDAPGAWSSWTPGAWLAQLIMGTTNIAIYKIQNILPVKKAEFSLISSGNLLILCP